jgi:hypothetical protein
MRTLLALASLTVLVAAGFGCGDDTTAVTADMTVGADMTAAAGDMAKFQTCAAVLACIGACQGNAQCGLNCQTNQSTGAAQYWTPYATCLYLSCAPVDGGGGNGTVCPIPPTTNPDQACQQCLGTAFVGSTSAGGACNMQYAACAAH